MLIFHACNANILINPSSCQLMALFLLLQVDGLTQVTLIIYISSPNIKRRVDTSLPHWLEPSTSSDSIHGSEGSNTRKLQVYDSLQNIVTWWLDYTYSGRAQQISRTRANQQAQPRVEEPICACILKQSRSPRGSSAPLPAGDGGDGLHLHTP